MQKALFLASRLAEQMTAGPRMLFVASCLFAISEAGLAEVFPPFAFPRVRNEGNYKTIELPLNALEVGRSVIPISLIFNTKQRPSSSINIGTGWSISLLDSVLIPIDEGSVEWIAPSGKSVILSIGDNNSKGDFDPKVQQADNLMSVFTSGGWIYKYRDGRLVSAAAPDKSRIEISRYGQNKVRILGSGKEICSIEPSRIKDVIDIRIGAVTYSCFQDTRPLTEEVFGHKIVSRLEKSIAEVTANGSSIYHINYSLDESVGETMQVISAMETGRSLNIDPAIRKSNNDKGAKSAVAGEKGITSHQTVNGWKLTVEEFTSGMLNRKVRSKTFTFPNGKTKSFQYRYDESASLIRIDEK